MKAFGKVVAVRDWVLGPLVDAVEKRLDAMTSILLEMSERVPESVLPTAKLVLVEIEYVTLSDNHYWRAGYSQFVSYQPGLPESVFVGHDVEEDIAWCRVKLYDTGGNSLVVARVVVAGRIVGSNCRESYADGPFPAGMRISVELKVLVAHS